MTRSAKHIECQTTLKDRFRLTTVKSTDARIKRYLATATGCGIVTARDVNDFSVEKVREIIAGNNVTLDFGDSYSTRVLFYKWLSKSAVCRAALYRSKILLNVCSNEVNADLGRRNVAGKSALLEESAEIGRQKVAGKTATNKVNTDCSRQKEPK